MADLQPLKAFRKRQVVDTSTAETIGRVTAVQVDPRTSRMIGFLVKGDAKGALPLSATQGTGPDAITVASADAVQADGPRGATDADARGSLVLDEGGTALGEADDLLVDDDGAVVAVVIDGKPVTTRLLGIGGYAVVVARPT